MEQTEGVDLPKHIANRIKATRKLKGWTQAQLADETAHLWPIDRSTIAKIEQGSTTKAQNITVVELFVLAMALDVPPAYLLIPLVGGPHRDTRKPEELFEPLPGAQTDEVAWRNWVTGLVHLGIDRSDPQGWQTIYGSPIDDKEALSTWRHVIDASDSPWRRLSSNMRAVLTNVLDYSEEDVDQLDFIAHRTTAESRQKRIEVMKMLLDRELEDLERENQHG